MSESARPVVFGDDLPQPERDRIVTLRNEIAELLKLEPKVLRSELGISLSFDEVAFIITRIRSLVSLLRDGRIDEVWGERIDEIARCIAQIRGIYQQMGEFSGKGSPAFDT